MRRIRKAGAVLLLPLLFVIAGELAAAEVTVDPEGAGTFRTIQEAVNAAPLRGSTTKLFLIAIKPGIYREKLTIPKDRSAIKLRGEAAERTILTWNDSAESVGADGKKIGTFQSASTFVFADDFSAENVTFENSFGRGSQALAIHVAAERAIFRKCRFLGRQDTVLLKQGRSYFEQCFIAGDVDFVFGAGRAWFEKCEIHCLAKGYITAASTSESHPFGFVFSGGKITVADGNFQTFLGRPWRPAASVTFLHTEMPAEIRAEGWSTWRQARQSATPK